jgi:hypothetical protein
LQQAAATFPICLRTVNTALLIDFYCTAKQAQRAAVMSDAPDAVAACSRQVGLLTVEVMDRHISTTTLACQR